MKRLTVVILLLASITITACNSGSPPGPEIKVAAVAPLVAARGQVVTIGGAGFGSTAGALTIGGVAADIMSWTESEVRASIGADASHAWQDLIISSAAGESATVPRFFVGVEYAGQADGLSGFLASVEADSALLIGPGIFDLPASAANLDFRRNGLYGHGRSETVIRTSGYLRWIAGSGQDIVLADLTIKATGIEISNAGLPVTPAAPRLVVIRDSELVIGNQIQLLANELDAGVLLDNVKLDAPAAKLILGSARGVQIAEADLTAADISIDASEGLIAVIGNDLTASLNFSLLAGGAAFNAAEIRNNRISVIGDDGPALEIKLTRGFCEVAGNHFTVRDTGEDSAVSFHVNCGTAGKEERQVFTNNSVTVLGDASADNPVHLRFAGGFLEFSENTVRSDRGIRITLWGTADGNMAHNKLELGGQGLMLWGNPPAVLNMTGGNHISTEGLTAYGSYGLAANVGSLTISGENRFTNSGPESGTAVRLESLQHRVVTVRLNDAVFEGFSNAFRLNHPAEREGFDFRANFNHFDFPITASPQVASLSGVLATDIIDFNHNKWGGNTDEATLRSFISPAANSVILEHIKTSWP